MRKIYRNCITPEEAELLLGIQRNKYFIIQKDNNVIVDKVINVLKTDFDFEISNYSKYRVEHRSSGHEWHKDTGSKDHMKWCQVGVSILLKDGDGGGDTFYSDDITEDPVGIKSDRNVYDMVAHTSDEWHMVTPHSGERLVFLMFI